MAEGRAAAVAPVALDDAAAAALLPERPARAHKGTFGRLLLVAGSLDYAGAALLVAAAASRAGAGLVTLAVPGSLQPVVSGRVLEVTTTGLPETEPGVVEPAAAVAVLQARPHEAIVVGPGLRAGPATDALVVALLRADDGDTFPPAVVDAEALNALARTPGWWGVLRRPSVLTPHPGEFARLVASSAAPEARVAVGDDDAERAAAAARAAEEWGQVVVLKGARTIVASPGGQVAVAPFENPALATAGTGDVLSGVIGALLAQGLAPWDAARLGVYLHGMAGDAVREALGEAGAVAQDLVGQLPVARRRLAALAAGRGRPAGFGSRAGP